MSENRIRVMLIEGDGDESSLVQRHLRDAGDSPERYDVRTAVRVSTACRLLAHEDFDVVILDLKVPQNVGLEGFTRIRMQRPEIPVILLAGLQDEALARQAVQHGAQDFLVKGTMDCCLLKRTIRTAIEKKKLSVLIEGLLEKDATAKLIVDGDAIVLYANAAAEALLGGRAKELTGKPFAYPRTKSPDEMSVMAVDWNGAPARLISISETPAASRSAARPELDEERRRLDAIKAEFMRRLAHELRNTMATVRTALFCLNDAQTGPLTTRQARLLDMVTRNTERGTRVFDKILDLVRFDAGKLSFAFKRLDLSNLLAQFARESEFKTAPVRFELDQAGPLPEVDGDADLLLQVIRNLVDNASRYAKTKVVLKASTEASGAVRVCVSDDGEGIPKAKLAGLFTPFSELDKRKGSVGFKGGLGLTMCHEIVTGHRGRIWADSDETGSRFFFTLPPARAPEKKTAETAPEGALQA